MKKGMTLAETIVASAITSLLLVLIGSSFILYTNMNNRSIIDSRSGINLESVKNYIINMTEDELWKSIDCVFYKLDKDTYEELTKEDSEIKIVDEDDDEVDLNTYHDCVTINDEVICYLPLEYKDKKINVDGRDIEYLDLGESIYYKKLYGDVISFESFTYDNEEFEGILSYGEEKIFTDLPYDEVRVDYSLVDYDYYIVNVGDHIEYVSTNDLKIDRDNHEGVIKIRDVDYENNLVTLEAVPYYYIDDGEVEAYEFDHWDDGDDDNPITVSLKNEDEYKAIFKEYEDEITDIDDLDDLEKGDSDIAQYPIKRVYSVICDITYKYNNQEQSLKYVVNSYSKYIPDMYIEEGE